MTVTNTSKTEFDMYNNAERSLVIDALNYTKDNNVNLTPEQKVILGEVAAQINKGNLPV